MRLSFAFFVFFVSLVSHSHAQIAALVGVDSNNVIHPPNGAASITQLTQAAAQALAAAQAAQAASAASAAMSNRLDAIEATIASQQQHAIFRGFVTSFSSAIEPVTNCDVQIIGVSTYPSGTNYYSAIATWFSEAPNAAPTTEYRARLTSGEWTYLAAVSNSWPDTVDVVTTGGVWQAYLTTVSLPAAMTSAFFRVNGSVTFVTGDEAVLNVSGGLAVNGMIGLTTNIVSGAVTNRFVGGVLVP